MKTSTIVLLSIFLCFASAGMALGQSAAELVERAKVSTSNKEYTSAIADLTAAIKADAANSDAFFRRAYAYYLTGEYTKGLADVDESIDLNAQFAPAFGLRGMIHSKQKDYDTAIIDNTKAIELAPGNATWLYNRAVGYEKRATPDWTLAAADLTRAIALDPKDSDSFSNRGLAYVNLKEWAKAEADYTESIRLGGNNGVDFSNLAYAQFSLGRVYPARVNAKKALELSPDDGNAKDIASRSLKKLGAIGPHSDADLFNAVLQGDTEAVELALAGGASPNAAGNYHGIPGSLALIAASALQNYPIAKALIDAGANLNAVDSNGNTPLSYATGYSTKTVPERAAFLSLLIKGGADVNAVGKGGTTPLMQASLYAYYECFELLIKAGARVSTRDSSGNAALHMASSRATPRAIKMFLDAGANVNVVNNSGETPFAQAVAGKAGSLGKVYLMLRAGGELIPTVDTKDVKGTVDFINRMKGIPANSLESKLLEATAIGRDADVENLLTQLPNLDHTLLDYLLLMSVDIDNGSNVRLILARGANASFVVDDASASSIVRRGLKPNSAPWVTGGGAVAPLDTTTADDERKMATLVNGAASGITYARKYMGEAQQMIDRGDAKQLWCVRVGNAKAEILQSRQALAEAAKINVVLYRSKMQLAKDNLEDILRSINRSGCF